LIISIVAYSYFYNSLQLTHAANFPVLDDQLPKGGPVEC